MKAQRIRAEDLSIAQQNQTEATNFLSQTVSSETDKEPGWRHVAGWVKIVLTVIAFLVICGVGYWKWTFPYGWSHCCIKGMASVLETYARDHQGRFPTGGATPEASLSLLYSNYVDAYSLRGKTVPLQVAEAALAKDGRLGPESCDWHYVEGLTESDDPEIAILWDKVGLGHNGQRMKGGGHEVAFVDGSSRFITGAHWAEFRETQKRLLANRDEKAKQAIPALVAKIRFPDGTEASEYDGSFVLMYGSGRESGSHLELRWMRLYESDGPCTFVLELPALQLRSKPVTVQVWSNRATPDQIVFEMQKN